MMKVCMSVVAAVCRAVEWRVLRGLGAFVLRTLFEILLIGPVCVVMGLFLLTQLSGEDPWRATAEGFAEMGEGFRGAPAGYVSVPVLPSASFVTTASGKATLRQPLEAVDVKALPRHLVSLEQWIEERATSLGRLYQSLVGATCLVFVLVAPFRASALPRLRQQECKTD